SVAELTAQVADRVEGRICLIGSTATGAADFVPTPVAARTPGVHVHGRVLETILSGRFIRRAGMWADLAAILACGAVAATVAAFRPILQAAAAAVVLAAGYAALNAWAVFGAWGVWLAAVAPVAAMGASFTAVTVYRELAEQRARRRIRAMFARALSPELVDRLVSDPSLAELGGQRRDVTCLVADLAGFTALSRRLGPRGTVAALNRFFDRLSDVVGARHGGYVNKFLGDGVLCLFGAPVAQADHPARAVRAAVDCLAAVDDLDADGARLSLRVGVACGEAMVGNCGSTDRMDYTAIGDCVNLASRLESANKFFGSHVLVTEKTWQAGGGDDLACRRLGRVRISGVAEPVAVREVIGAAGDLPADRRDALATFAEAIEHFQRRDFAAAAERLERVAAADPNDRAAKVYLSLARAGAADAADADDWPGECVAGDAVVQVAYPRPDGATSDG
ncbi:MAG: adenylate/guanylate cyclase domain-containing protein, partial [Planctomycetota bacterium]